MLLKISVIMRQNSKFCSSAEMHHAVCDACAREALCEKEQQRSTITTLNNDKEDETDMTPQHSSGLKIRSVQKSQKRALFTSGPLLSPTQLDPFALRPKGLRHDAEIDQRSTSTGQGSQNNCDLPISVEQRSTHKAASLGVKRPKASRKENASTNLV